MTTSYWSTMLGRMSSVTDDRGNRDITIILVHDQCVHALDLLYRTLPVNYFSAAPFSEA